MLVWMTSLMHCVNILVCRHHSLFCSLNQMFCGILCQGLLVYYEYANYVISACIFNEVVIFKRLTLH